MIVDQLRCGGVLEAVRVSRAGYPTRYPHDVFKARYYILGDAKDRKPVSPIKKWGRGAGSMNKEESAVKRLVSKIAFDIWEADHEAMIAALEEDGTPIAVRILNEISLNFVSLHFCSCMMLYFHHLLNTGSFEKLNTEQFSLH